MPRLQLRRRKAADTAREPVRWDEWHKRRDLLEQQDRLPTEAVWRSLALAELGPLAGKSVLDCGCARGGFDRLLADQGADVTAVDWSTVAVELTRRQLDGHGRAVEADARHLPFRDNSFDISICLQTLNHVKERERLLAELVRVTKPTGKMVVTVSNAGSPLWLSRQLARTFLRRRADSPPREHALTVTATLRLLRRRGVDVQHVTGDVHAIVIPGHSTINIPWLARLPAAHYIAFHVCIAGLVM